MGDYVQYNRIHKKIGKDPVIYTDVVEPIIPRYIWEECQLQKEKNQRTYTRDRVYPFFQKLKCPKCGKILKCKGSGSKDRQYTYYNCETCRFNIRDEYVEKYFIDIAIDLMNYDEKYNKYYLPLYAEKNSDLNIQTIDKEIENLNNQKDRIKKAYMMGIVEVKDFDEDLKMINQKLDALVIKKEEQIKFGHIKEYNLDKTIIDRDISRFLLDEDDLNDKLFSLQEWKVKTQEEKQEFIARHIESMTFEKDKNERYGIKLVDIEFKSLFKEKITKLGSIGLGETPIDLIINDEHFSVYLSYPYTKETLAKYLKGLSEFEDIKYYEYPKVFSNITNFAQEFNKQGFMEIEYEKDEKVYRVIPILENNIVNKDAFKLGIVTIKTKTES